MGQNLSRKLEAEKGIFLPDLTMSNNSVKIHEYRGWKVAVKVKISAHSEQQIRNEKLYRA